MANKPKTEEKKTTASVKKPTGAKTTPAKPPKHESDEYDF